MRILYIDVNAYKMCRLMRKFLQVLRVNARLSVNIRGVGWDKDYRID